MDFCCIFSFYDKLQEIKKIPLGVFVAKGDVGIGTIVGSAVFNILVIIGLCALLCDKVSVFIIVFNLKYDQNSMFNS